MMPCLTVRKSYSHLLTQLMQLLRLIPPSLQNNKCNYTSSKYIGCSAQVFWKRHLPLKTAGRHSVSSMYMNITNEQGDILVHAAVKNRSSASHFIALLAPSIIVLLKWQLSQPDWQGIDFLPWCFEVNQSLMCSWPPRFENVHLGVFFRKHLIVN